MDTSSIASGRSRCRGARALQLSSAPPLLSSGSTHSQRRLVPAQLEPRRPRLKPLTARAPTAPARVEQLASPTPRPDLGSGGPLDGSPSRGEPPSHGRRRPPPAEVIRLEFLSPRAGLTKRCSGLARKSVLMEPPMSRAADCSRSLRTRATRLRRGHRYCFLGQLG